jgi:acyl-CoA thioesterase-1
MAVVLGGAIACGSSSTSDGVDAGGDGDGVDAGGSLDASIGDGSPALDAATGDATDTTGDAASDASGGANGDGGGDAGGAEALTAIAFIGDSITEGDGASSVAKDWVSLVGTMFGPSVTVGNFGESGATMLKVSDDSYWTTDGLADAESFLAHADAAASGGLAVVIMLGTNDSKDDPSGIDNWNGTAPARFVADYGAMIDALRASSPSVRVFLALPPPAYTYDYDIDPTTLASQVVPLIRTLAAQRGLPLIDVFDAFGSDAGADFPEDGIHPDDTGQAVIAQAMYSGLLHPDILDGGS